jgi:hypothetical protein
MINRFLNKTLLKTVDEYGRKLASDSTINPKETEKCHLAKLVLISESQHPLRIVSLKTLADVKSHMLIPHTIREIILLAKRRPNEHRLRMILDLYSILCSPKP